MMAYYYKGCHFFEGTAFAVGNPKPVIPGLPWELQAHIHDFVQPTIAVAMDLNIRWGKMTLSGHKAVITSLQFDSTAMQLLSGSFDGTVRVWDSQNPKRIINAPGHVVSASFVSSDTMILCVTSKSNNCGAVTLYDLKGTVQSSIPLTGMSPSNAAPSVVVQGDVIAISRIGLSKNNQIALFNWRTGALLNTFSDFRHTSSLAVNGNFLLASSPGRSYCYKLDDYSYARGFPSLISEEIQAIELSDQFIVFLNTSKRIYVFTRKFKPHLTLDLGKPVKALKFDKRGLLFALYTDKYHYQINLVSGRVVEYDYV